MRNKLLRGTAALVLLTALGHFSAKPLLAQIRAALVKNIDERGRSPYTATVNCSADPGPQFCRVPFPTVPANKRLVVEYINGYISITPPATYNGASLDLSVTGPRLQLPAHFDYSSSFANFYSISERVVLYIEPGQTADAQIDTSGAGEGSIALTLSGYLVDLTQ
jgi:hypothetical protein